MAIVITLSAAAYQRMTGPTYPLGGKVIIDGQEIKYKFGRSHGGNTNQLVSLYFSDSTYQAIIKFTYYKTDKPWQSIVMHWKDGHFSAELPNQPPAGKLEYYIRLSKQSQKYTIPIDRTVVTRFKGEVPAIVLIPHVLFMFIAMLISSLSALEAVVEGKRLKFYVILTTIMLFMGGMILGPVVQKFAFGEFWTGVPFGFDLVMPSQNRQPSILIFAELMLQISIHSCFDGSDAAISVIIIVGALACATCPPSSIPKIKNSSNRTGVDGINSNDICLPYQRLYC